MWNSMQKFGHIVDINKSRGVTFLYSPCIYMIGLWRPGRLSDCKCYALVYVQLDLD